jgi:hypothetical protein
LPLFNLPRDADGGIARLAAYEAFTKMAPVNESVLRSVVPAAALPAPRVPELRHQPSEGLATTTSVPASDSKSSPAPPTIITQDRATVYAELVKRYGQSIDIALLLNTSATQHQRYGAAIRPVVRRRKGKVDCYEAVDEVLQLVELGGATGEIGPATGPRTEERVNHVERGLDHWQGKYDHTIRSTGSQQIWFYDKNLTELEDSIRSRISKAKIAQAMRRHPHALVTYAVLAMALAYWLKNIHTRQVRTVPVQSIKAALRHHNLPYGGSTVAAIAELLKQAEFIRQVYPEGPGRARSFMLHARCPVPAWLEQHCDKIQIWPAPVIEATAHQDEPAQITGRPALPPSPPDKCIRIPLPPGSDEQLPFDAFDMCFDDQIEMEDGAEPPVEYLCSASTARRAG